MASYSLPTEIEFDDGSVFPIRERGDFRMVLDCFEILNDQELTKEERLMTSLIVFLEDFETMEDLSRLPSIEEAVMKMNLFFNCGEPVFESDVEKPKLIDWEQDSVLIFSAVNNVAGREIRLDEYLHWWTFIGYYMAVGESSLATVVGIRSKIAKNKPLEKYEKEFKRENPKYFSNVYKTAKQLEDDELVKSLWNSID